MYLVHNVAQSSMQNYIFLYGGNSPPVIVFAQIVVTFCMVDHVSPQTCGMTGSFSIFRNLWRTPFEHYPASRSKLFGHFLGYRWKSRNNLQAISDNSFENLQEISTYTSVTSQTVLQQFCDSSLEFLTTSPDILLHSSSTTYSKQYPRIIWNFSANSPEILWR